MDPIINSAIEALVSAILLWMIGKKMEYDFLFRNLLLITVCAALAGHIPIVGLYVKVGVYYFLFYLLEQMPLIEIRWVGLMAFGIQCGVAIVIMFSIGTLSDRFPKGKGEPSHHEIALSEMVEKYTQELGQVGEEFTEEAEKTGSRSVPAPSSILVLEKEYRLSGIASSNKERVAVINDRIMRVGDSLSDELKISRIEEDFVELISGKQRYKLYPKTTQL